MLPFELTKDTPHLSLSGELWSVFYEYFNRNWSCYKGFLLYIIDISLKKKKSLLVLAASEHNIVKMMFGFYWLWLITRYINCSNNVDKLSQRCFFLNMPSFNNLIV